MNPAQGTLKGAFPEVSCNPVNPVKVTALLLLLLLTGCQHPGRAPYPIGIYSVPKADLPAVREAGFNIVTGPAERAYLDAARRVGLKVLASPGASAGKNFSAQRARQVVGQLDRHPALWAWYLVDEPDLNGVSPEQVKAAQRFVKSLGARKPTALVLYQGGEALDYANIADVTMVDRYPIPWLPLANFPQHVRLARLALGPDKPLIAVIQAFDWSSHPKLLPGERNLRPPTYKELRCMTYCALARRATGLFYYCFDDHAWKLKDHPAVWDAVREVVKEVNQLQPLFEGEHVWWPYVHAFPDPGTGFNAALESSICSTLLRVRQGNTTTPAGDYLLTVNNTDRTLAYRITMPPTTMREVAVLREDRNTTIAKGWLEDKFGPLDVHIYGPMQLR
jgi:hypothetical protein